MTPAASWALVLTVCLGLPALVVWCCCVVSGRAAQAEDEVMRDELHRHTCTVCGRVQRWRQPHDQWSPCVACQAFDLRKPLDIDLDDFADADAIRVYLDGHERLPVHSPLAEVRPS